MIRAIACPDTLLHEVLLLSSNSLRRSTAFPRHLHDPSTSKRRLQRAPTLPDISNETPRLQILYPLAP